MKLNFYPLSKAASSGLLACFLIAAAALTARSQMPAETPQPDRPVTDVQQLKDRVKQLEQTVDDLKKQIGLIEDTQKPVVVAVPNAVSSGATTSLPAATATAGTAAKKEEGNSSFEIYGFAMLDAGYQFGQNHPDWFDVVRPTQLPSFHDQFAPSGKVFYGVRQSRMGVKFSTPTKMGELKTTFEFELFGTGAQAGQTIFRLRHAYGELGHFGAGQYWTVFGDTDAYPNSIEYWGPNGLVWFRNVQVRWMPLKGRNSVTIALERPGASGDQGNFADRIELSGIKPKLAWPDLTGNVRWDRDWGHLQLSGIVRSIRWVDTNHTDNFDFGGSAVGYGGSVSSHLNFSKNYIGRFQFTFGKGIENYMNDAPVDVGAQLNLGDVHKPVRGVAIPVFGMSTFLDHTWNKSFTSSIGYSRIDMSNSDAQAPSAFHIGQYGLANLLYYPVPNVMIGGEFQWGRRENFLDGFASNDFRIQFSFKYNFSKVFKFDTTP